MKAGATAQTEAALVKLFELAVRLTELMQRGLEERGLTPSRAEALLVLHEAGAMVQREISDSLRCTPRYVTALIDTLEEEGLVWRRPHPTDRRATLVSLTKRGAAAAARLGTERREAAEWLLGDVSPADLATFVTISDQVLDRVGGGPSPAPSSGREQSQEAPRAGRPRSAAPARRPRARRSSGVPEGPEARRHPP